MTIFRDDRELLDRFRRGERAALVAVYRHYIADVAQLARRGFAIGSDGHARIPGLDADAERDLVQETFVRAFGERARQSYDGVRPYRPFLLRIAKNLMIDRVRARLRDPVAGASVGDIDEILASDAAFAAESGEADDSWQMLVAATAEFVAGLDREAREIVRQRFEQGRAQDAVAEQLGCSRRRVRTLEERVQKQLRRHLIRAGLLDS